MSLSNLSMTFNQTQGSVNMKDAKDMGITRELILRGSEDPNIYFY